jgi:hypothetical protein
MSGLSPLKSYNYNDAPNQGGKRNVAKKHFDALGLS